MKLLAHAKEGLLNLYHAKLRAVLALMGVLVGTASVVAMVLGGQLATHEALKQFKSLGTDLLAVTVNNMNDKQSSTTGKSEHLSLDQALGLAALPQLRQVAPYTQSFYPAVYQGQPIYGMVLGVTDSFANIIHLKLDEGRFVSLVDQYAYYCVIGQSLYASLKKISFKDPLGQTLQMGKNIFLIIGVLEAWPENSFVYADINNSIIVPIKTSLVLNKYTSIRNILVRLAPHANIEDAQQAINNQLQRVLIDKQLSFRSAKEIIAKMRKQNDILTVFLGLIGSISLIVGGIGVMNIMLVSVMERRREIGIRLAVGATRKDIAALFLMEAVMLSLAGGVSGVVIGILIAYVIAIFSHWEFTLFLWPPLIGFSVSVAVGIFFGFYPAYLASRLSPIDALRST